MIREKLQKIQVKRLVILNLPYFFIFYVADKGSWLYRHCLGESMVQRLGVMLVNFRLAFLSWLPSVALQDLAVGVLVAGALKLVVYYRSKNAKKFRQGVEYGSARWGNRKDIEPFMDPVFENNVILTETERLTMNSRPKAPKYARNKNVIVIGGSGSGKTRFYVKPNLMQMTDHEKADNVFREAAIFLMLLVFAVMHRNPLFALYGLCIQTFAESFSKFVFVCRWFGYIPVKIRTYVSWWILPGFCILMTYLFHLQASILMMLLMSGSVFLFRLITELYSDNNLFRLLASRKK